MDRLIIVLLGVASLYGCKSSSLSSKVDSKTVESVAERDSAVVNTDKSINWKEIIDSDIAVMVEEVHYDTEKEINKETKLPPVKSVKTVRVDKKEVKDTSRNTLETVIDTSVKDTKKELVAEDKSTIKESINKQSPLKHIKSSLWALVVLTILFFGYRLYHKF